MVEAHRNQAEYRPKSNSPPPTVKPVPLLLYVGNTSSPEQREYPPGATTGLFPHGAGVLQGHPLCLHHQHPQATKPCSHEYMLNFSSRCSCPISGKIFLALALAQADAKLGDPHELVLLPEGLVGPHYHTLCPSESVPVSVLPLLLPFPWMTASSVRVSVLSLTSKPFVFSEPMSHVPGANWTAI